NLSTPNTQSLLSSSTSPHLGTPNPYPFPPTPNINLSVWCTRMQTYDNQPNDAASNRKAHTHITITKNADMPVGNSALQAKTVTSPPSSRSDLSNAKQQQQQQQQPPAKPPQQPPVIRISPPEFQFYTSRHSNGFISRLTVKNLKNNPVGFKFKTNAPLRYSVKPVLAVLQPNASLEVFGTRRLADCDRLIFRSESQINPVDRFLIQSVLLTEEEAALTNSSTWKQIDRRRLMENFINCCMMRGARPRSSSAESMSQPRVNERIGSAAARKAISSAGSDEEMIVAMTK
ncbi:PapD-like protein, partial [Jimgerdemannia flammicorona]